MEPQWIARSYRRGFQRGNERREADQQMKAREKDESSYGLKREVQQLQNGSATGSGRGFAILAFQRFWGLCVCFASL